MATSELLVPRRASSAVDAALLDTRVVVLNGARQTGKSTLAEETVRRVPGAEIRFLDNPIERRAAQDDLLGFVRHRAMLAIDEVQWVPELMLSIKYEVDTDPRPGRFLLTGSAKLFGLKDIPDLLPGRTETIELWPLSQGRSIAPRTPSWMRSSPRSTCLISRGRHHVVVARAATTATSPR